MRRLIAWLPLLLVPCIGWGQSTAEDSSTTALNYNPDYITDHFDQVSLRWVTTLQPAYMLLHDDSTGASIKYKPNQSIKMGFAFSIDRVLFNFAFNLPFLSKDEERYGKTSGIGIQSNLFLRKYVFDLVYQNYKGFYISNPQTYIPGYSARNYPQRPDINSVNVGGAVIYIFNNQKFSYKAAFTQTERQIKNAGSWVTGGYFNYFSLSADSTVVPSRLVGQDYSHDLRHSDFYTMGISGGYGYSLVFLKHMFLTSTLTLGLGAEVEKAHATDLRKGYNKTTLDDFLALKVALGYNGKKYIAGISAFTTYTGILKEEDSYVLRNINNFKIYIGMRFAEPKFLTKPVNKIDDLFR
ncbi:DUF4421 family protein [Reichenbachiella agariperforans]|uniref:DUF4421 family protein n=1 Tax=Reichenbachiella agariperforans TaxID=156994 RepID=UPI001C086E78|nr:DUF4421 family protein [Reichenbachiella agariperforans]MBU2915165.1 DUF4421 domain-containing protein [Reichenbachiella agariperforans]